MSEVKLVNIDEAVEWYENDKAVFVDVRTVNEVVALNIPNSVFLPVALASKEKVESFLGKGKKIVVYCHTGRRSAEVADKLSGINNGEIYSLDGGIAAWKKSAQTTETISSVISVERQTHITAGFLTLSSLLLGVTVDSRFLAATAFFGGGLMFAGLSGSCLMGILLGKMPWNKR